MSTSAVLAGHSRGGSAVNMLVDTLYDTDEDGDIDDLSSGSAVDDYEICATVSIAQRWGPDSQSDTRTDVDVLDPDVRFSLVVAAKGTRAEAAPAETERYVIFYRYVYPAETVLPDGTIRATTHALARRIRAREATVTVPGL